MLTPVHFYRLLSATALLPLTFDAYTTSPCASASASIFVLN